MALARGRVVSGADHGLERLDRRSHAARRRYGSAGLWGLVARLRNIRVWAFEEGYLRPHYITMEEGGVNGNSMLPHSPALLRELAESHPAPPSPVAVQNPLSARVWKAIAYYAGTIFLRPFFPCFRTHRPQSAVSEVWGWFLRVLTRRTWERRSAESVREIYRSRAPYFLFPLQLDSDSQVRWYRWWQQRWQ